MNTKSVIRIAVRVGVAVVVGFLLIGILGALGHQLVGRHLLERAGWVPGADPPALYVWFTLAKGFGAAVLAGAAVAKIARTFAIHAAVILVGLGAAQGVYQIVTIVESHPHWYAFVLPLLLVPGVPLGVLLVRRVFPDPVPVEQPEES